MVKAGIGKTGYPSLWRGTSSVLPSSGSLYFGLTLNANIPLKFWRPNYRFLGLSDEKLYQISNGTFPRKLEFKMRPIHSLEGLPYGVAFKVCPCSSKRPFDMHKVRFVREGCRLLHTNEVVDRNSYLVENVPLNIPSSIYRDIKFRGEVPVECIEIDKR
jgi:hypothetical protein